MSSSKYQRIWDVVAEIPYGRVASYGQIARIAGLGGQARQVGYALHSTPDGLDLPWHRVINAQGRISFPKGSPSYRRQRELLEAEGIEFSNGRLDLTAYRWQPGDAELPKEYLEAEQNARKFSPRR
ncbi:MAG: MGMT family protein [Arenicellales bacterium]|nr:MGMT family protein [Arenicellales bacterium]